MQLGTDSVVSVESQYADSEMVSVSHQLSTPSNITIAAIADMMIEENTTAEGLSVIYNDVKGTANGMTVSGDNISAVVSGEKPTQ